MEKPKISVITVCFNAAHVIEKTILSVINQTYPNVEYIVVDGGSNDGTIDIIKKYEAQIDKWISEPDDGIFDAMNKGIRMASGEWLNMMNAGDFFFSKESLSEVFSEIIPVSAKFLYSDSEMRFEDGRKEVWEASEKNGDVYHQSSIYKKELHDEYGYYCRKKPLIMSDVLFFNLIPSEYYYHTSHIIASYDMGGVSIENMSCRVQVSCLKYIFHKISFGEFTKRVFRFYIKSIMPATFLKIYRKFRK